MNRLLMGLMAVLMLVMVGCGAGPGDRVKEFTYAMEKGDTEKVKEVAPGIATIIPADKLDGMIKEAAADAAKKGGVESITIDEEKIEGDTATVKATLKWGNGETETDDFKLSKVDGDWIIVMDSEDKDSGSEDGSIPSE